MIFFVFKERQKSAGFLYLFIQKTTIILLFSRCHCTLLRWVIDLSSACSAWCLYIRTFFSNLSISSWKINVFTAVVVSINTTKILLISLDQTKIVICKTGIPVFAWWVTWKYVFNLKFWIVFFILFLFYIQFFTVSFRSSVVSQCFANLCLNISWVTVRIFFM